MQRQKWEMGNDLPEMNLLKKNQKKAEIATTLLLPFVKIDCKAKKVKSDLIVFWNN